MLIYANPTTVPARRRTKKKGATMKRKRSSTRRASSRRRVHSNPSVKRRRVHRNPSFKAKARRRVHRNPSRGGGMFKGILGELASMNGAMLIGAAVAAPIVTDFAVGYLPTKLKAGYTGLLAKAVVVAAGAWALDRFVKSRHAAIGFAAGGLGKVISDGINLYKVNSTLPTAMQSSAAASEIAKNPSAVQALMDGSFDSLNGYAEAPQSIGMAGYEVGLGSFESLN